MPDSPNMQRAIKFSFASFLFLLGIYALGYWLPRTSFYESLGIYAGLFIIYLAAVHSWLKSVPWTWWVFTGFAARFLLLLSSPELSDDYYRFIWDGICFNEGINPYAALPSELIANGTMTNLQLYEVLNSQGYYSVYPPISQAFFSLSTWLGNNDVYWSTVYLREFMLLAELITIFALAKLLEAFGRSAKGVLWYAMNPLVIMEFTGNLHTEGFMLCFLVLGLLKLHKGHHKIGFILLAWAILFKIIPVLLLPFIWRRLSRAQVIQSVPIMLVAVTPFILLFYHPEMLTHIGASMKLYFSSFEFNSSIYQWSYVHSDFWKQLNTKLIKGSMIGCYAIFWWFFRKKDWKSLPADIMVVYTLYFIFGTTLHPWYILVLVAFTPFVKPRFAILWTALIFLTYGTYITTHYKQPLIFILLEYVVLFGFMLWEVKQGRMEREMVRT